MVITYSLGQAPPDARDILNLQFEVIIYRMRHPTMRCTITSLHWRPTKNYDPLLALPGLYSGPITWSLRPATVLSTSVGCDYNFPGLFLRKESLRDFLHLFAFACSPTPPPYATWASSTYRSSLQQFRNSTCNNFWSINFNLSTLLCC